MSSRAGSSIGAFLMSMPVSAIVLMGLFGVPKFSSSGGHESGWQNARQFLTSLTSDGAETPPVRPAFPGMTSREESDGHDHSSAPGWSEGFGASARSQSESASPFGMPRSHIDEREGAGRSEFGHPLMDRHSSSASTSHSAAATSSSKLTWSEVSRKLSEKGIRDFHLEPGSHGDQYLFVCLLCPGGDSRVTRRFEAEASEPLAAVEKVLHQVDHWLAQQYEQENRATGFDRRHAAQ